MEENLFTFGLLSKHTIERIEQIERIRSVQRFILFVKGKMN